MRTYFSPLVMACKRVLQLAALLTLTACGGGGGGATISPASVPTHLGANMPGINDYAQTPVFVDVMKQARHFGTPATPWDEIAVLGSDGWPVGDFGVWLMVGQRNVVGTAGTYKLSFAGQATVVATASSAQVLNQVYDAAKNSTTADVVMPVGEDQLALAFTNTGAGVKNIKLIRPNYNAVNPPVYTTHFLDHIARFKTLRFMDWLRTNGNAVTTWATRADPATTHYASLAGVPWEDIIALANVANKDIWINIPVSADDNYVLQLAQLMQSTLNTNSKIYIEYSNEVWNGSFAQFTTNYNLAQQEVASNPASPLVYDGTIDPYQIAFRRVGKRLKEISDIFRGVYGNAAMMTTIRPVLSGQVVQPYVAELGLKFVEANYGAPSQYFYAIAGAPYFNMGANQFVDGLTASQVLQALDTAISTLAVTNAFEKNRALASWYGLHFLAYEAGPDTFGIGSIPAKKAANLDPQMYNTCLNYLNTWYSNGGEMMLWFMAGAGNWDTQYGTWELTTDITNTTAPKIRCMDSALAAALPASVTRNQVPGTFEALAMAGNFPPYSAGSITNLRYLHPNSYVDYLVFAPNAGNYSLVINAEAGTAGNTLEVSVNRTVAAPAFALAATGWGTPANHTAIPLSLPQGYSTIRLKTVTETSGFSLVSLTVR